MGTKLIFFGSGGSYVMCVVVVVVSCLRPVVLVSGTMGNDDARAVGGN